MTGDHVTTNFNQPIECVHKSKVTQLVPLLNVPGNFVCTAYTTCGMNERVALAERHGIPLPPANEDRIVDLGKFVHRQFKRVPELEPMTWEELLADVPKNRVPRVRMARDALQTGWSQKYTMAQSFIKFEKWEAYMVDQMLEKPMQVKSPRLIQCRPPMYTYSLAKYLRRIEQYLLTHDPSGRRYNNRNSPFAKSMTSWQIGANIAYKARQFSNPCYIMLDYSRMDSTLRKSLRESVEWSLYRRFIHDPWFWELLKAQERNKVTTRWGNYWTIIGTMLSGEYNTSIGDTIINWSILKYLFQQVHHELIINGDDAVIIIEQADLGKVDLDFGQFGMIAKVDYAYDIGDVSFCQCTPMRINGAWRMVRNWNRVMSRSAYTTKQYEGKAWLKLLGSIGVGEMSCNNGVPVLQSYACMLWRSSGNIVDERMLSDYMYMRRDKITTRLQPITMQARLDFEYSFGVAIATQLSLESLFDNTVLPCLPK